MTDASFKPQRCLLADIQKGMAWLTMLTANRLAAVASEVNLRECITHLPLPSVNKAAHPGFETQGRCQQKSK